MKTKKSNPTNSEILILGIAGLIASFLLKFSLVKTAAYAGNLSGFLQILSCVLISYCNCDKRRRIWEDKCKNLKSKRNFIVFCCVAFFSALILLIVLHQCPMICWLVETVLSILLGFCVSINDIVFASSQEKEREKED